MAGKRKKGLRYAGWNVDIFDGDTKIDKLLEAQGWVGFGIYFYLCQMAYKFDEYFYRWSYDDAATTARRMGGGVRSETVKQTVGLCLQIGLFDKRLFDRDGILTSRGIQRKFCAAIQTRRRRIVIKDYWLLDDEESDGLEMCDANGNLLPANEDLSSANGDLLPTDGPKSKVKESKEKKSRVLGGAPAAPAPTPTQPKRKKSETCFVPPTVDEVAEYVRSRGSCVDPQVWVDYYAARGWKMGKSVMTDWKSAVRLSENWERWKMHESRSDVKTPSDYEGEESFV